MVSPELIDSSADLGLLRDADVVDAGKEHATALKVYCQPYAVASTPMEQTYSVVVPPMEPLPETGQSDE